MTMAGLVRVPTVVVVGLVVGAGAVVPGDCVELVVLAVLVVPAPVLWPPPPAPHAAAASTSAVSSADRHRTITEA
jgi:hypothetical protein